jgi:hypothetical protein
MEITIEPACRVGWEGETLHYVVRAAGATEILVPENDMDGSEITIASSRQVGDGVEAEIEVRVLDSKPY